MLRSVLFDFNGVIVDDEPLHRALFLQVLAEAEGLEVNRTDYRRFSLGRPDQEAFRAILSARGRTATAAQIKVLTGRKSELYRSLADPQALLLDGVRSTIEHLTARGLTLAIVSGALREEIDWLLSATGLVSFFPVIISAEDIARGKPDPEGYALALARAGVEADESLAIEDSFAGIEAARAAGISVLALPTSVPFHMLQRRAGWVIDRFAQFDLEAIERVYERRLQVRP